MRTRTAFGIPIGVCVLLGGLAAGTTAATWGQGAPKAPVTCRASQPVYTTDYIMVGDWRVALFPGQHVTLPDGDNAVCGSDGQLTPLP